MKEKIGSPGGKATALISRKLALDKYYASPSTCKSCGNIIDVKDGQKIGEVKVKQFCNRSCSSTFNNRVRDRVKKEKVVKPKKLIVRIEDYLTKGELFSRCLNWQSARSIIRRDAKKKFVGEMKCLVCDYEKHVEIAHIKAVSDFGEDELISVINDKSNLVALCPNHHWEYDNLDLEIAL